MLQHGSTNRRGRGVKTDRRKEGRSGGKGRSTSKQEKNGGFLLPNKHK